MINTRAAVLVDDAEQPSAGPADVRQHERRPVEATVDFVSESNFYSGLSENLSVGGIFIATFATAKLGERVRIRFALPDDEAPIEAEGEVRWLRVYDPDAPETVPGMGLRFTAIDGGDLARIAEFVQAREPLFYEE